MGHKKKWCQEQISPREIMILHLATEALLKHRHIIDFLQVAILHLLWGNVI